MCGSGGLQLAMVMMMAVLGCWVCPHALARRLLAVGTRGGHEPDMVVWAHMRLGLSGESMLAGLS